MKNKVNHYNDHVGVLVYSKGMEYEVLMDVADYDSLCSWYKGTMGMKLKKGVPSYPHIQWWTNDGKRKMNSRYVHRVVMGEPEGLLVDHIDGNPLDSRRSNLRVCTQQQNASNRERTSSDNVWFSPLDNRFRARLSKDGRKFYGTGRLTREEAQEDVPALLEKHYGEFGLSRYQGGN